MSASEIEVNPPKSETTTWGERVAPANPDEDLLSKLSAQIAWGMQHQLKPSAVAQSCLDLMREHSAGVVV